MPPWYEREADRTTCPSAVASGSVASAPTDCDHGGVMDDLADAVESLTYWRGRAERLPWYRVAARREARELARNWESRVSRAVIWERGVSLRARLTAGLVLSGARLERVRIKRWLVGLAVVATTIVVVPLALTVFVLAQIF